MKRAGVPVRAPGAAVQAGAAQGVVQARVPGGGVLLALPGGQVVRAAVQAGAAGSPGQALRAVQLPDGAWAVVG